jgi:Lamin Tail Domain
VTNTNSGQRTVIDPFGWDSPIPDAWAQHPQGASSLYLWLPGQAPPLAIGGSFPSNGGTPPTSSASVAITTCRSMGVMDDVNPNNEFVELTVDPRFAPSGVVNLTGFTLKNNRGDIFTFPPGFTIQNGQPARVHTGAGLNGATQLFWNLGRGARDNNGDCIRLIYPSGGGYQIGTGPGACR